MNRLRSLGSLVLLVLFEAGAFIALRAAGTVERWRVDWAHLWHWIGAAPPADVAVGLLRWVGLAGTVYLGVTTALFLLAALTRAPGLIRAAGVFTIPGVRRVVEGSVAVGILASTALTRVGPALAQEPAGGWVKNTPTATAAASPAPDTGAVPPAIEPTASEVGSWTTAPGDNYWDIAAAAVAHARGVPVESLRSADILPYWQELMDRSGGGNSSGDPNLIFPGEVQTLPPVASIVMAPPAELDTAPTPAAGQDPAPASEPENSAPVVSEATSEAPDEVPVEQPEVPVGLPVPAPAASVGAAGGEEPALAGTPVGDAAAGLPLPADATVPPVGAPDAAETLDPAPAAPAVEADGGGGLHVNGPTLLGAGLLAAGVVATLNRLRRAQMRRRRPGHRIALPGPEAAGREWAARVGADDESAALLDLGLRAMVRGLRDAGIDSPEVVGVELGDRQLEVILSSPSTSAPDGFRAKGRRWVLAHAGDMAAATADLAGGIPDPLPGLVTLGRTTAGSQVLVDLEEAGLVAIAGDADVAREMVVAAAMELANKGDASLFHLVLVGFGDGLDGLERVQVVDSLDDVIEYLESEGLEMRQALEAGLGEEAWSSTLDARVGTGLADSWAPTLVLCSAPPNGATAERLVRLTSLADYVGVGVMVAGDVEGAGWQLRAGDVLDVPPLGLQLVPQRLTAEEAASIGELYEVGRRDDVAVKMVEDDVELDEAAPEDLAEEDWDEWDPEGDGGRLITGNGHGPAPDADVVEDEYELEDAGDDVEPEGAGAPARRSVLVRVLGPVGVEVDGVAVKFERPKSKEAIAYLATNRDGVRTGDRLAEILWPDRPPKTSTNSLNTAMWGARNHLGTAPDGTEHLPRLRGAQREYALNPDTVELDYDLVVAARKRAQAQSPEKAIATLREALKLVRGTPFDHVGKGYEWAHAGGLVYDMAAEVADAAHELAGLCMAAGDFEGANRAVGTGHRASPGNETLYQDKMMAAGSASGRAGVEAVMAELSQVTDDEAPYAELDPETVSIYESLKREAS